MNPHQKNKIDISSLSEEEQRLFRLYGKLPNRNDLLQNKLKERKYFDSGDYALSKAGKATDVGVTSIGSQHPSPETIPHLAPSPGPHGNGNGNGQPGHSHSMQNGSPVKESSFLHRGQSIDDGEPDEKPENPELREVKVSPPPAREGVPIRWQH
ncbi:Endosulfine-domain-containing protein [Xylona heveae TC161]|uniref:mRNA stability protein n=1 Tax=Xylona heveae (strain CBS 132557 / TC161) TaxID=1328760 RepID=A0A165J473_XYLHT|nr:Endosulfine-domain-containing protein [Xylona heveae TC161]KZF25706.1 Endosulfine-domain-containing protein [Xylona heveae TC161]